MARVIILEDRENNRVLLTRRRPLGHEIDYQTQPTDFPQLTAKINPLLDGAGEEPTP